MADVYGRCSPKYSTVAKWLAEFKRGRDFLEDGPRPGGPADVINQEMTDRAEAAESKLPNFLQNVVRVFLMEVLTL